MPSFRIKRCPAGGEAAEAKDYDIRKMGLRGTSISALTVFIHFLLVVLVLTGPWSVPAFGEDPRDTLSDGELDTHVGAKASLSTDSDLIWENLAIQLLRPEEDHLLSGPTAGWPAGSEGSREGEASLRGGSSPATEGIEGVGNRYQLLSDDDLEAVSASVPKVGGEVESGEAGDTWTDELKELREEGDEESKGNYREILNGAVEVSISPSRASGSVPLGVKIASRYSDGIHARTTLTHK